MRKAHSHSGSPYESAYGFCRAVRVDNQIEVAGTAPIPVEGEQTAETAYDQMLRCGEIMLSAIAELGGNRRDVIRTRMYITDAADADAIGRAHKDIFGGANPVATMVVVASLLDPSWRVEAEATALLPTRD